MIGSCPCYAMPVDTNPYTASRLTACVLAPRVCEWPWWVGIPLLDHREGHGHRFRSPRLHRIAIVELFVVVLPGSW